MSDNDRMAVKSSAREAAVERAMAAQAAVEEAETDGGTETVAAADDRGPEEAAGGAAPVESATEDATATDDRSKEVSEAARTLANRRAELRAQVRKEMEEAGELEPEETGEEPETEVSTTPETEEEPGTERAPTDAEQEVAAEIGPVSVTDESELPEIPNGFTWVEIPPDNPLRTDRGHTHIPAAKGAEDYIRAQLNNPIRNRQVQDAERRAAEAERRMAELEARIKARESEEIKKLENPELQALLKDMEEAGYSEEAIELVRKGVDAQRLDVEEKYARQARQQVDVQGIVHRFWDKVNEYAPQRYKVWEQNGELESRIRRAVNDPERGYARYLDAVEAPPDLAEFFTRYLDAEYAADPRVLAAHRQQQAQKQEPKVDEEAAKKARAEEVAKLKEEIRAELRAEAEEARKKRATNPLGRLPASQPAPRDSTGDEVPQNPSAYRKQMRERAMARVGGGA